MGQGRDYGAAIWAGYSSTLNINFRVRPERSKVPLDTRYNRHAELRDGVVDHTSGYETVL